MDKPFKTTDLWLAAYLAFNGMEVMGCVPKEGAQLYFVFKDEDGRDDYVEEWLTGRTPIKRYVDKLRLCQTLLKRPIEKD